jgi:hypothetical protein
MTQVFPRVADEVVADGVGIPVGSGQQVLDAVGRRVAQALGQLPPVLPLGAAEQPAGVADGTLPGLAPSEPATDPLANRLDY